MPSGLLVSLDELRVMVAQTLSFIRGESAQEVAVTIDLGTLLMELVQRHRSMGHQVEWADPIALLYPCRPLAMKRALSNLIENAIKYGGSACLSVHKEQAAIRIEIADAGPGIDPAWLERVFEPYVQLRSEEGKGVGLAIAKSCIQAHGVS